MRLLQSGLRVPSHVQDVWVLERGEVPRDTYENYWRSGDTGTWRNGTCGVNTPNSAYFPCTRAPGHSGEHCTHNDYQGSDIAWVYCIWGWAELPDYLMVGEGV